MKQLRRTIRKILLENEQYEAKILEMFGSGDAHTVVQAIELADQVGVLKIIKRKELQEGHPFASLAYEFEAQTDSFAGELASIAPELSDRFYKRANRATVFVTYSDNQTFSVMVDQR